MTVARQATLADGRRAEWHDDLGPVGRYRVLKPDGTVAFERDYDDFEQGQAADDAARRAALSNDAANRTGLRSAKADLDAQIGTIGNLASSASGNTRVLAVGLLLALRLIRRMGRILTGDLTAAD